MRMHHAARCGVPMHMHDPRGCNPSRTVRRPAVMRPRPMFLTRRYLQSPIFRLGAAGRCAWALRRERECG